MNYITQVQKFLIDIWSDRKLAGQFYQDENKTTQIFLHPGLDFVWQQFVFERHRGTPL